MTVRTPGWGSQPPCVALIPCSLSLCSAPLSLTSYWLKTSADFTVSSLLPYPTIILDDFKSTWVNCLSVSSHPHFTTIFTQCCTSTSLCQLVKCVRLLPALPSVTSTLGASNQPWWDYLHHGNWQMLKHRTLFSSGSQLSGTHCFTAFQPPNAMAMSWPFASLSTFQHLKS